MQDCNRNGAALAYGADLAALVRLFPLQYGPSAFHRRLEGLTQGARQLVRMFLDNRSQRHITQAVAKEVAFREYHQDYFGNQLTAPELQQARADVRRWTVEIDQAFRAKRLL